MNRQMDRYTNILMKGLRAKVLNVKGKMAEIIKKCVIMKYNIFFYTMI